MAPGKSIVVSGDLGSGKSTVSRELARRLDLRRISVGDLYRQMALSRGMSALQLNLHAELDDAVDGYVDQLQQEIAKSDEQLIMDGRLAWFFFTDAFKVHLITDPGVAAGRVLARPSDEVEAYSSLTEAKERLKHRGDSERIRFLTRYGADKNRLRNYDLVCDTTAAPSGEVVEAIIAAYQSPPDAAILPAQPPLLLLDPRRIYPTHDIGNPPPDPEPAAHGETAPPESAPPESAPPWSGRDEADQAGPASSLRVGYTGSSFCVVHGHRLLSEAIRTGRHLIAASLLAEGAEQAAAGLTALQYFELKVTPEVIEHWERAHGITLRPPLPPPSAPPAGQ